MIVNRTVLTLDEFTIRQLRNFPQATGELSNLLRDIGLAAKCVNDEVNKAGLVVILGETGSINNQGEEVKKLDLFANDQLIGVLRHCISCAGIASEELEDFLSFDDVVSRNSKYICLFDPLNGSANIDTNISIGTIFSVYRRVSEKGKACILEDFLQTGIHQIAAGYIIYGSSTMLVYATRLGVNGFTLDPSIGEFTLSHPDITCPDSGKIYTVNHGNFLQFSEEVKKYIESCQKQSFSERYVGSMVADLHRNIIKGGIFLYPATIDKPEGKLRLLYECNPFAFIMEVAGGRATNGSQRILDIRPTALHERTPFFAGSKNMMDTLESLLLPS